MHTNQRLKGGFGMSRNLIDLINSMEKRMEKAAKDSKPKTINSMSVFQRELSLKGLEGQEHKRFMIVENSSELILVPQVKQN